MHRFSFGGSGGIGVGECQRLTLDDVFTDHMERESRYLFECDQCNLIYGRQEDDQPTECEQCEGSNFTPVVDANTHEIAQEVVDRWEEKIVFEHRRKLSDRKNKADSLYEVIEALSSSDRID